jgi:alanine dehydrogenase
MKVGILKEIKVLENRVCMVPSGVATMIANGHEVVVETMAGAGAGYPDAEYVTAGASIVASPADVYGVCDMVMHVKEPQPSEYDLIREGQIVFTYLHLAADLPQTEALVKAKSINIAYETIE